MNAVWKLLGDGLELVAGLLDHGTPEAIAVAKSVVTTLREGHAGALAPEDVTAKLQSLRDELAANDDAALAALHARFPA